MKKKEYSTAKRKFAPEIETDLTVPRSRIVDIGTVAHDFLGGGRGHSEQE